MVVTPAHEPTQKPTPAALRALRSEVRAFITQAGRQSHCDCWMQSFDKDFSRALAERGWVGMTIPQRFGGGGRTYLERYVVTEELLRAGAPVAAHWFADRQIAPALLAAENEPLIAELLPRICRGELQVAIGMSEPNAGSDLAAISTQATRDGDEWVINGQKVWTSGAMSADYLYLIARTERVPDKPHEGLSEFVVPMDAPGLTVRPIEGLAGEAHFAELFFTDLRLESWRLVGEAGQAFATVVKQLDYERSGPERFLSTYPLFKELVAAARTDRQWLTAVGDLAARFGAMQAMSMSIAAEIDASGPPSAYAALAKDLGAQLERDVIAVAEELQLTEPSGGLADRLREAQLSSPNYTIRGGTAEILRDIVARRMLKLGRAS